MRRTTSDSSSSRSRLEKHNAVARRHDEGRRRDREVSGRHTQLFEPRQQAVQPLEQPDRKLSLGRQDLERLEIRHAREQIEVGGRQAVEIVRGLTNRNDRRPVRPCQWRFAERVSQAVLVEQSRHGHAALVARERGGEEPGLAQQAFGSGIEFGGRFERRDEQPLEVFDGLPMATERIIEVQHLADEGRTQMEGRRGAVRDGLVRGGLDQHLALEHGQETGDGLRPLVQPPVPVAPRQQIRQDNR